jgi:putative nucleotidyltransferase-like protein
MLVEPELEPAEPDSEVTERMARFAHSLDLRALWPTLSESALVSARRAVERAVRAVLADAPRVALDPEGQHEPYALSIAAFTSGTGALLERWREEHRLEIAPAARHVFAKHLDHGRRRAARLQRGVLPVFDALLARDITPVLIKGSHTSLAYCEEPGVRPIADVDIVIPPGRVADAESALQEMGFQATSPALRPYKRHWIAANVDPRVFSVERSDAQTRWHLDLHASFDRPFGDGIHARIDGERHSVAPLDVSGRILLAPTQPLLLLVLACQLSADLDSMRLMRLVDLVRVIRTDLQRRKLDWDELLAAFERTGVARYTYPALALAEDLAPGTIDGRVLSRARAACNWAIRSTVDRLTPSGGYADHRSIVRMFMWANSPLGAIGRAMVRAASLALGDRNTLVIVCRAVGRRVAAGAYTFGVRDERADAVMPRRHRSPKSTTRAGAARR